ncbi:MAG: hypothetical protein F4239_04925, partial [Gammaproteobacteria bacterium]|nr:hypothetical protein [Gammaproteobacteria bacterium]
MKHVQNKRTQRLLLCVLLSLVVHVGLAASFVSVIQPKSVHLEIVNPIQVSLVQDVSDAIGTTVSQSIESNQNQFPYTGTQRSSIDLNQPADNAFDSDNEVSNELDLAVVVNLDTHQSTEFAEIEQPSTPLPVVEEEMKNKLSEPEVQPTSTKFSDFSSNTGHSSEPNELESNESKIVKAVTEPIPSEHVSEQLTRIAETVTKPTNQMAYISVEDEFESRIESVNEPVSDILQDGDSNLLLPTSSEIITDVSDADELAGIWSSETIESVSVYFEQLPSNKSTSEEIAEPAVQVKAAGGVELPEPVSIQKTEIAQVTPPNVIDIEFLESEISSTTSIEHKTNFDEQFTNYAPSNPIQTAYSRIDDGLDHLTNSEFQPVSEITPTENSILPEQKSAEHFSEVSDADELAGIWSTEAIEPATLVFDQPPSNEPTSEKNADFEIQVASISELPNSVENLTKKTSQISPTNFLVTEHVTEQVSTNFDQTVYFEIDSETEIMAESDYQLESDITPVEIPSAPELVNAELAVEIPDADELAGIWPTEAIEPAVLDSDQLLSSEVKPEEIVASQTHVASATDLIEPVQHDANQVEPEYLSAPTILASGVNQITSDLDKEITNENTVDLNDSRLTDQALTATDQLAYAIPQLEPTPTREEIFTSENAPSIDGIQLENSPTENLTEAKGTEPKVDELITKQQARIPETIQENQPEVDDSSPSNSQVSPDLREVTENERITILKERQQVASVD